MAITSERPKVYIESSTISYLTSRPTEEPIRKAKQILTRLWWERKDFFDLYISQTVVDEIRLGDTVAAGLRIDSVHGIPILEFVPAIQHLTQALLQTGAIPEKSEADAVHIAYHSTWHGHVVDMELKNILQRI